MGSCLTLGNELSEKTHRQKTYEKGCPDRDSRVSEPRRIILPHGLCGRSLGFYGNMVSFPGCVWPVIFPVPIFGPMPGGPCISQPR